MSQVARRGMRNENSWSFCTHMSNLTRPCSRCGRNRSEKFFTSARGKICSSCRKKSRSKSAHETRVNKTYGLLPGEYDRLLAAQNGRCAICHGTRSRRLAVDHSHSTGLVRGLLCARCNNQLLAKGARDDPGVLERAAQYLRQPPAIEIIGERKADA